MWVCVCFGYFSHGDGWRDGNGRHNYLCTMLPSKLVWLHHLEHDAFSHFSLPTHRGKEGKGGRGISTLVCRLFLLVRPESRVY